MKIKVKDEWSHHTNEVTTVYQPGEYDVSADVAAAFKGEANGDGSAKAGAAGDINPPSD